MPCRRVQIIPAHLHQEIEQRSTHSTTPGHQSSRATSPKPRNANQTMLPANPSPIQTHFGGMPSPADSFDEASSRAVHPGSYQCLPRAFPEPVSPAYPQYSDHQHPLSGPQYFGSTSTSLFGPNQSSPGLPSLRSARQDRPYNGIGSNYAAHIPADVYGYGLANGYEPENNPYGSRRPALHDQVQGPSLAYGEMSRGPFLLPNQRRYQGHSRALDASPGPYGMETDFNSPVGMGGSYPAYGIGDTVDPRTKRRRGNLPKQTTDVLRQWLYEHVDHPYPTDQEKQMLMEQTNLSMSQIR